MTEEERVKYVNEVALIHLHEWLLRLEKEEVTADDLVGALYGCMIAAILLGYAPESLVDKAIKSAEEIEKAVPMDEDSMKCGIEGVTA